jgi:polar amino acid transport system substrate-binding protein
MRSVGLRRAHLLPSLAVCLLSLAAQPVHGVVRGEGILQVGVVDGSPPCSYREAGVWRGLAVDLWSRIATREGLPYVLHKWSSVSALLEATGRGEVDVAVGCLNVSPERLARYRFTLPFQEDGLAVMVLNSKFDLGRAFLSSLLGPSLLQLLGGYLLATFLLAALTWRVENYGQRHETIALGKLRSFSKLFQVLATGPGSNVIVVTTRGNLIVLAGYLVRIVSASLLVGYLTVNVVTETQGKARGRLAGLADLAGWRVAVRSGTVSESVIRELNAASRGTPITPVPIATILEAVGLLRSGRADAVLADNLQLRWLVTHAASKGFLPTLSLEGLRPESQAFALSPTLPVPTTVRIDLAISALKRSGVVSSLRDQAVQERVPAGR